MTVVRDGVRSKTYANATKVFDIPGLPIAVMTYGAGALGRRSIASLIDQWIVNRPSFEKTNYTVEEVARNLGQFIFERHREFRESVSKAIEESQKRALSPEPKASEEQYAFNPLEWTTGLIIGGFQPNSMYPWVWTWEEPARPQITAGLCNARPHEGENGEHGPESGLDYWGETKALDRLVRGHDPALLTAITKSGSQMPASKLSELLDQHRWDVIYEGMPIKDAADLAKFVLEVGVGFHRFDQGIPQVGGDLDIAIITRRGVHWADRKQLSRDIAAGSPFRVVNEDPKAEPSE